MKRFSQYIFLFFVTSFLLHSCSFVGQYSFYQSSTHYQNKYSVRHVFNENDYQRINKNRDTVFPRIIPHGFNIISFGLKDFTI
jgi:hypothetical protein